MKMLVVGSVINSAVNVLPPFEEAKVYAANEEHQCTLGIIFNYYEL